MKKLLALASLGLFAAALSGCGSDKQSDPAPAPAPASKGDKGTADGDGKKSQPAAGAARLSPGKYFLSAGSVEAFDSQGNKVDPQTLQVTGEYTWTLEAIGGESYQLTETGAAKISNSNQVLAEFNCRGARNVYTFELTSANAVRGLKQLEAGCPVAASGVSARQFTLEPLGANAIQYVEAQQNAGVRAIVTLTFQK